MIYVLLFVLWLCFGSFGSVITHRLWKFSLIDIWEWNSELLKTMKWIAFGRSHCPHCKHTLHGKDLIPLVSYVINRWKCGYCKKSVSMVYPLLEIWVGILFVIVGHIGMSLWFTTPNVVWWLAVCRLLYLLIVYDIQTSYLHEIIRALTGGVTIFLMTQTVWFLWYYAIQRGVLFLLFFLFIYYLAKLYVRLRRKINGEWFGIWDVRLSPIIWLLFWLTQVRDNNSPVFLEWIMLFQRYIIISWVLWLAYAWVQKILRPKKSIREIPFFPGMIVGLWAIMLIVYFQ